MTKKCPFCAETIQEDAKKCRYCGEWLTEREKKQDNKASSPAWKYYLIWLISIIAFFSTFFFSENGFISDLTCIIIVGICSIVGIIYFIKLLVTVVKFLPAKKRTNFVLLIIATFALFFLLAKINPPVYRYLPNEAGLRKTIDEQYKLANQGEQGTREIYRNYLSASFRSSKTEDDFVKENMEANKSEGIQTTKYEVHDVLIDGIEGFVDRTVSSCTDTSCTNVKNTSRVYRKYLYEDSRWRMTQDPVFCPRKQMYEMEPEFTRALSLINQRFGNQKDTNYQYLINCVDIQYAKSDSEINNAEGLFTFVPGQTTSKLEIFVSPRYKYTDDLLTAYLLSHELTHAMTYTVGQASGIPIGCFESEATAFDRQIQFLKYLNKEEITSLDGRLAKGGSEELRNVWNTTRAIAQYPGSTVYERALNYVKSNLGYQKQCNGR